MIRCAMKMQKNQVGIPTYLWMEYPASGMWYRGRFAAAGYTKFDLMIVGGAGGPSGRVTAPSGGQTHAFGRNGGGGGGAFRRKGTLTELNPAGSYYFVGGVGTFAADVTAVETENQAGTGGTTLFDNWYAYGGVGAKNAKVNSAGGFTMVTNLGGRGGMAGGTYNGSPASSPNGGIGGSTSAPGVGGMNTDGSTWWAMSGGGGGIGRHQQAGGTVYNAQTGGAGAAAPYSAIGEPSMAPAGWVDGGSGGGADVGPWTADNGAIYGNPGQPNIYGSSYTLDEDPGAVGPGVTARHKHGVILLKIS